MSTSTLWGILFFLYVIPFWVWQSLEYYAIEARSERYPGNAEIQKKETMFRWRGIGWCFGLLFILVAWDQRWHPIGTAIVLFAAASAIEGSLYIVRRWQLFTKRFFRMWLAGSLVWALGVGAWYLVFGRNSDLRDEEFFMLALFPPLVIAFGSMAWHWAKKV